MNNAHDNLASGESDGDELSRRAERASREKFDEALAQVPTVPPMLGDEL